MTEESAVKVCVRVRPLIQREEASTENSEPVALYWKADKQAIHQIDDGSVTKTFSFDRVFSAEESTNQLYQDIAKPLVVSAVEGYNGTIFAYGQTSSGKTFTMMGSNRIPGVIPLAMEDVFQTIKNCPKKEFLLRVSYMEIYNETVTDLLCDSWKRKPLEIREGNYKNVYVADLTEELVTSAEQALSWIRKGEKNRHYGKTKMNQRSSRSHTIFRMILESRERSDPASGENADGAIIVSHLNLVDLAGAERASQTGAEGARLKEGCNINRSLFTLGQVIKKLSDENQGGFTNYRDSKLTRILQNSLGGNAKTVIICTITPATVEETISTLQFASAAKRMKNDPHVTEVSDDGALLRRYRNEIVDLKRRLQEVSSVTQTTATEKEVLAQLLQEKDQLQREQQDRIRNLTKIIVTSSNFVVAEKKVPKRRVTWGGKLFRPVQSGDLHIGDAEFGPSEPFVKKRKADLSVLLEQDDDSAEFDSQWETPDDIQFDIEMNQSNVTIRSVTDSDFPSPSRLGELSEKVASLEMQLQMETQQKQEAVEMSTSLEKRVAELEKQLEVQEQELLKDPQEEYKKDLGDTIQLCEALVSEKANIAAERDLIKQELSILKDENLLLRRDKDHLLKEIEEKREMQEFSSLEQESAKQYEIELLAEISSIKKVAEKSVACVQKLEADMAAMSTLLKRKEEVIKELQNINGKDLVQENQQLRRSLADAEELSRETKKEWAFLRSDNLSLKERDSSMSTDYEKMKNEVTALCSKLEVEKSRFKKMQVDLQKELQGAFEENTKLTTLLDGKVPKNLIDSIELERTVTGLKKELEMHQEQESFLQSKVEELEALKDLPVQVESLKKQICDLTEELCAARAEKDCLLSAQTSSDAEIGRLTAEVQQAQDQLAEAQAKLSDAEIREDHLSQQHLDITQQAEELKAELKNLTEEKCQLLNTVEELNMKAERSREHETSIEGKLLEQQLLVKDLENKLEETQESSTHAEEHFKEISKQHQDQITQLSEELQLVRSERDAVQSERTNTGHLSEEEQEKLPSQVTFLTEERDQLQEILEGMRQERNQLKRELQEKEEMVVQVQEELRQHLSSGRQALEETAQAELQQKIQQLTEELEGVREERTKLQSDLQENMETATETKNLLQSTQEELKQQQQFNTDLKMQSSDIESHLEQIKQLSEELQLVCSERDALLSERTNTGHLSEEEQEKLCLHVTSLTEERDQLQEILEGVREERNQLKRELQEKEEMMIENREELRAAEDLMRSQQENIQHLETQVAQVESVTAVSSVVCDRDQPNTDNLQDQATETLNLLHSIQEELKQQQQLNVELKKQSSEIESQLEQQITQLSEELQLVRSERDALQSERTNTAHLSEEEQEKLHSQVTSLTEERDQLQEILEGVREDRNQLKVNLQEKEEMVVQIHEELRQQKHLASEHEALRESEQAELQQQIQQLNEELEGVKADRSQLKCDMQENVEMMIENQDELRAAQDKIRKQQEVVQDLKTQILQLKSKLVNVNGAEDNLTNLEDLQDQVKQLSEELQLVRSERDALLSERTNAGHVSEEEREKLCSHITSLTEERDQLQEILEGVREERNQLKRELQEKEEMSVEGQAELLSAQEELKLQQQLNSDLQAQISEKESQLEQITQLSEELQLVRSERDALQSERTNTGHLSEEEQEELRSQVTSLTEERDQLQEILEGVREERNQLKRELQEKEVMSVEGQAELLSAQEELKLQQQLNSDLQAQISEKESQLQQITQLSEELQLVRSERDALQSERTNTAHLSEEEQEKLCSQVTSLTEERDQLQEILEGVREERNQLKRDLQEKEESVDGQAELLGAQEELKVQQQLNSDLQAQISEKESRLEQQVAQVQEELRQQQHLNSEHQALREREQAELHQQIQQLTEELEGVREERTKLQSDLQENTEMAKETQNLLHSIQEDLKQQQVLNADLKTQNSEIETRLELQIKQLNEELQLVRSERDALQSERTNTAHLSEEEQEKLRSQVTSLSEARDQLQEVLEGVREERSQLKRDLLEKEETLAQVQKQLLEKEHLNAEQQTLREKEQAEFQQQIQKLAEELEGVRKECQQKAELEKASQEALSEANAAIASLREQIRDLEEKSSPAGQGGERLRARLEESELELQKVLEKFQKFADSAAGALKSLEQPLKDASLVQNELAFQVLASIPKPLRALYVEFRKSTDGISDLLWRTARGSAGVAQLHRQQLEAQASQDAACFEESRLQDLLIRAARDPSDLLAATSDDFRQVWDQRLHELLERREQKLQEMNRVLAELEEGVARNAATVSEELPEQQRTNEELRALVTASTLDLAALESLLERERARRTLVLQSKKAVFLNLQNEYFKMGGDLKAFKAQASQQLKEERSRSLTLLQKRESGPAKSEAELLQSLQELTLKLQQSEMLVKVVQTRAGELEEAQARAEDRVSKHKEATQLLQTELQDVCAQLKEREGAVRGLEGKLRDSEVQVKRGMAPSAVELEEMKNKLIKMELELTARASTHQEELEKMTSMLDHKEEALRKLKEALRKTQQQGDESFMEESVYAKGTATIGGRTVQSSIVMEKNRLEEEVKQLKKKIVQLESLISSQQLEITKWKTRATKLKENRKEGVKAEMPLSPHTPTKRRRPITSEGHILDSPKSKFFDARSVSESVSANCPKQFFDNSTLGNVPEVLYPPTMPELGSPESPEIDLNAAVEDKNAEWWPMSPTQSDNCKTQ
ncbi:centromere-associated protein E isoform X6 [Anguilla anguilla]|uniref:centromere-associated protein E isoform X6 n=1 Tax=Anguilla anguilla TaxID=7936 RepID=UPI0015AB86DE|nr:centromere-associated protein E isoform X6 [Anguilla anguilla]